MAQNLTNIHASLNDSSNDFLTNINNDPNIVGGPYTVNELMEFISWIGLENTQDYIDTITNSTTSELEKKQYIEGIANSKYTKNCNE